MGLARTHKAIRLAATRRAVAPMSSRISRRTRIARRWTTMGAGAISIPIPGAPALEIPGTEHHDQRADVCRRHRVDGGMQ